MGRLQPPAAHFAGAKFAPAGANSARLFQQADFGFFSKKRFPSGDFCDIVNLLNYRNLRQAGKQGGTPFCPSRHSGEGQEPSPAAPPGAGERGARDGKGQPV